MRLFTPGDTYYRTFTTSSSSGVSGDADSTPSVHCVRNGAIDAIAVTVTKLATGEYSASFTIPVAPASPAWSPGDEVDVIVAATIGGNVYKSPIDSFRVVKWTVNAVLLDLTQKLSAPRAIDGVADTLLTMNDAMHAAIGEHSGQEAVTGTSYAKKTPAGTTTLRTLTLDSATAPTQRT